MRDEFKKKLLIDDKNIGKNLIRINDFTMIESIYGKFIVNRHSDAQADWLIKTGKTHIEDELEHILSIINTLPQDCVVIDVGANIGLISIPIAHLVKNKNGVVFAYEVQRMLFYALCGGAALNDLNNLNVFNIGIGEKNEILKVPKLDYSQPQDFGQLSLVNQEDITEFESVNIIALDEVRLSRLDFLKIDVEGMELAVLRGARKSIQKYRPWCWIEYWKTDKELLKNEFNGLGYSLLRMDELNILCAPHDRMTSGISNNLGATLF